MDGMGCADGDMRWVVLVVICDGLHPSLCKLKASPKEAVDLRGVLVLLICDGLHCD